MERFWSKVNKDKDCWEWTAALNENGYGRFYLDGKEYRAHRWIFIQLNKWEPEVVMHTCDNPSCVNPDHLRGGTIEENNKDRDEKGRHGQYPRDRLCPKGHDDWVPKKRGKWTGRRCAECNREQSREYQRRKYAEHKAKQKAQG